MSYEDSSKTWRCAVAGLAIDRSALGMKILASYSPGGMFEKVADITELLP